MDFLAKNAYIAFSIGEENLIACRRPLYVSSQKDDGFFCRSEDLLGGLTVEHADTLARTVWSDSEEEVTAALMSLGAKSPLHADPRGMLRLFNRWAIASVGPRAQACWRQEGARVVGNANFTKACCWQCTPFSIQGVCEHSLLRMHVHGYENFSEAVPVKVKGKKKMRKEEQTEEPEEKVEKQCPVEDFAVDPALSMD
eukprot:symbB.v1.2.042496.t1/scaffold10209.1/size1849/1